MKEELETGIINVFSWRATGFQRHAKHGLNFPLDCETRQAKLSSQPGNVPYAQQLMKPLDKDCLRIKSLPYKWHQNFILITCLFSLQVTIQGEWVLWQSKVPQIEVETHKVAAPDIVVPTVDTVRHEALLYTWLAEHKPMVLCGPPGSGKTMTLFSALRALPDMEVCDLIWNIKGS